MGMREIEYSNLFDNYQELEPYVSIIVDAVLPLVELGDKLEKKVCTDRNNRKY